MAQIILFDPTAAHHVIARNLSSRSRTASGVPTYSSSGRRLRNYSVAAVEQLLAMTPARCSVKRSKTGRMTVCQLFPLPANSTALEGKETLAKTAHMGQHYSFQEQLFDSGRKAWSPARQLLNRTPAEERLLQRVFRAVPRSCLGRDEAAAPPQTPAPVVMMKPRGQTSLRIASDLQRAA